MKQTVFIIDDDLSARRGLARLVRIAGYPVQVFDSAESFLAEKEEHPAGCILLDVQMPEMTGPELQESLLQADYTLPIIFVSAHGDVPTATRTMKKGAMDFLTKPVDRDELLEAIEKALKYDREAREARGKLAEVRRPLETLTPREFEIMTYVIGGLLNKQIAAELSIAEDTVKVHRGRVMAKMGIHSVAELVRMTEQAGIEPLGNSI
jgi:FixJ family two-component response regulator